MSDVDRIKDHISAADTFTRLDVRLIGAIRVAAVSGDDEAFGQDVRIFLAAYEAREVELLNLEAVRP